MILACVLLYRLLIKPYSWPEFIVFTFILSIYKSSPLLTAISNDTNVAASNWQIILFFLFAVFCFMLGYALVFAIYNFIKSKTHKSIWLIALVIFFLPVAEASRGLVLSLLSLGHDSYLHLASTNSSLGLALALTPLLPLAYFGHVYYLCFILSLIVVLIIKISSYILTQFRSARRLQLNLFWNRRSLYYAMYASILVLFIGIQLIYVYYRGLVYEERLRLLGGSPAINAHLLILPSDIPSHYDMMSSSSFAIYNQAQSRNENRLNQIIKSSTAINNIDLIILPENIHYTPSLSSSYDGVAVLNGLYHVLATNTATQSEQTITHSASYYSAGILSQYRAKSYLFPFYEYAPYISPLAAIYPVASGERGSRDFYLDIINNLTGERVYKFGTILCSEYYSYNYMSDVKSHNYDFIVSQSSLSIFNHNKWLYANILLTQLINSAYTVAPIIQVSNAGPNFVIANGNIKYYSDLAQPFTINLAR